MKSAISNRRRQKKATAAPIRTMMTTTTKQPATRGKVATLAVNPKSPKHKTGFPRFTEDDIDLKSLTLGGDQHPTAASIRPMTPTTKPPAGKGKVSTLAGNPTPWDCGFDIDRLVPIDDEYNKVDRSILKNAVDANWKLFSHFLESDPNGFDDDDSDLKSLSLGGDQNSNPNPYPLPQQPQKKVVVNKWDDGEDEEAKKKHLELTRKYLDAFGCVTDSDSDSDSEDDLERLLHDESEDSDLAKLRASRYREHKLANGEFGFDLYDRRSMFM